MVFLFVFLSESLHCWRFIKYCKHKAIVWAENFICITAASASLIPSPSPPSSFTNICFVSSSNYRKNCVALGSFSANLVYTVEVQVWASFFRNLGSYLLLSQRSLHLWRTLKVLCSRIRNESMLGEFNGQMSLVGYSPWNRKESDTTEWLTLLHCTHLFSHTKSISVRNWHHKRSKFVLYSLEGIHDLRITVGHFINSLMWSLLKWIPATNIWCCPSDDSLGIHVYAQDVKNF